MFIIRRTEISKIVTSVRSVIVKQFFHTSKWLPKIVLISSELHKLFLDAILCDDFECNAITGVNLSLSGRDEQIMNELVRFFLGHLFGHVSASHVLLSDLIVHQGLEQRDGGATGSVGVLLNVTDGVIGVHDTLTVFVKASL